MKVRLTSRGLRVRIDDLELAALQRGEVLTVASSWEGGGWSLSLDPRQETLTGQAGALRVGVSGVLGELADPQHEGVTLAGPPQITVEKEFGPQHT